MLTFMIVSGLVYTVNAPKLSYTPNQKEVVRVTVAANKKWKSEGGVEHEESCFIDCTAFGSLGLAINNNVHQGHPLYIEGQLKHDRWEDKEGKKHSKHNIILTKVVFLKPKE